MRNVLFGLMLGSLVSCEAAPVVPAPTIEETTFAEALMVNLEASTKLSNGQYVRDLEVGTGDDVKNGQMLSVTYTGYLADGKQVDSNVGKPAFTFRYGAGEVITGWDHGFDGVKVGGSRQLIIPPALGYGVRGAPPAIPSNAILVFTVKVN